MNIYDYEIPAGLKFTHMNGFGDFLIVDSTKVAQTLDYIRSYGPVQLYLNWRLGFAFKDIDFLQGVEELINGLMIVVDKINLHGLENLKNLKYLHLSDDFGSLVDFEKLSHLNYCSIVWSKQYSQAVFPPSLIELNISSYRSDFGFNKVSLNNLRNVSKVMLIQPAIEDLSLLNHCGPLTNLKISSGRTLTNLSDLTKHALSLTHLELDNCKKIADFVPLSHLIRLQWLNLCNCKSIPNLSFVQLLPALDHFVFFGTVVEDGNLSYLRGMSQVAFDNKAHYSLKKKDFEYVYTDDKNV